MEVRGDMARYRVYIRYPSRCVSEGYVDVEAKDEDEAIDFATSPCGVDEAVINDISEAEVDGPVSCVDLDEIE